MASLPSIFVIAFVAMIQPPGGKEAIVHDVIVTGALDVEECRSKDLPLFMNAMLSKPKGIKTKIVAADCVELKPIKFEEA